MFESCFHQVGELALPAFTGKRVMMMPFIIGDADSIPDSLGDWRQATVDIAKLGNQAHFGKVGYFTLDEKVVQPDSTHRRAGKHVDGVFRGLPGSWGGGGWGSVGNGMLTVASHAGCRAWRQTFDGLPGDEGECDHLADQCVGDGILFGAGQVFWVDGHCVHESVPMTQATPRQFVRLSMPSKAPWFDGYTTNPLGIKPTGPILSRREFMDA
jgi:hypothetical protein